MNSINQQVLDQYLSVIRQRSDISGANDGTGSHSGNRHNPVGASLEPVSNRVNFSAKGQRIDIVV